jgi:hypothetical protein
MLEFPFHSSGMFVPKLSLLSRSAPRSSGNSREAGKPETWVLVPTLRLFRLS